MRKLYSIGLIRGLLWQILGTAIGVGILTGLRVLLRLTAWKGESAAVFGALTGCLFFLYGVGAVDDWIKVAAGKEVSEPDESSWGRRRYFGVSYDHKVIGVQYLVLSLVLMIVGGSFALTFRTELANTGMQFLTLMEYNTLMSLHGMVMIIGILVGVAAFMNYLIPMMIGASDMAFPRLNAFGFWLAVPASIILLSSMALGGFDTGWTGYPPLSVRAPIGIQMFFLGVSLAGLGKVVSSLNILTTVIRLRATGITGFRLPIFVWRSLATSLSA